MDPRIKSQWASFLIVLLLVGCAAQYERTTVVTIAEAYITIEALSDTAIAQGEAGRLTIDKLEKIQTILEQAFGIVEVSELALAAGDISDSQHYLLIALGVTAQIENLLRENQ